MAAADQCVLTVQGPAIRCPNRVITPSTFFVSRLFHRYFHLVILWITHFFYPFMAMLFFYTVEGEKPSVLQLPSPSLFSYPSPIRSSYVYERNGSSLCRSPDWTDWKQRELLAPAAFSQKLWREGQDHVLLFVSMNAAAGLWIEPAQVFPWKVAFHGGTQWRGMAWSVGRGPQKKRIGAALWKKHCTEQVSIGMFVILKK